MKSLVLDKKEMQPVHKKLICAALLITLIRFILRTVFVIITEAVRGIPLLAAALLEFAILWHLQRKGGCSATFLFGLVETFMCTIYYICMIFAMDTNNICREWEDICSDELHEHRGADIQRPYALWVLLIIPGLVFDIIFLYYFRYPMKITPQFGQVEIVNTGELKVDHEQNHEGISGGELMLHKAISVDPNDPTKPITGLNRPSSAKRRASQLKGRPEIN